MPSEFPPARLFLDDVEEIVHVLTELVQTRAQQNIKITVALSSGQQECDSVQDLPKILRMSESVEIEVYADTFAYTNLRLHPWLLAIWRSTGFTKESAWEAYHKLQPIFERRKRRLNAIFHALPAWSFALFSVAGLLIVEVTTKLGSVAMLSVLILWWD